MNQDVKMLQSVLDTMHDDEGIKEKQSSVEKVAWEINQYLSPSSLSTMSPRALKGLYMRVVMRHLQAQATVKEVNGLSSKTDQMQNKAIGGTWI